MAEIKLFKNPFALHSICGEDLKAGSLYLLFQRWNRVFFVHSHLLCFQTAGLFSSAYCFVQNGLLATDTACLACPI